MGGKEERMGKWIQNTLYACMELSNSKTYFFKTFIVWEFCTAYFDHIHPSSIPPRSILLSLSVQLCVLLNFPTHQVSFVLLLCSWICGLPLEHGQPSRDFKTFLGEFYINAVFIAFPRLPSPTLIPAASLPQILDLFFNAHINHTPTPHTQWVYWILLVCTCVSGGHFGFDNLFGTSFEKTAFPSLSSH